MSDSMVQFHDAQTLRYRTTAQTYVTRETVRISVTVNLLVSTSDNDNAALHRRVRETLARFIPAEWILTAPRRHADATGFERVILEATTRAPLAQDYNLAERVREAGTEGLSLTHPEVDHRLPASLVAAAVQDLRLSILRDALAQAEGFGVASELKWHVADIEYGVSSMKPEHRSSKGAYREELDDLIAGEAPEQSAERIRLIAAVVLRATPTAGKRSVARQSR